MLHAICAKLEIDVMQAKEIEEATDLAIANCLPALVVHQDLVSQMFFYRGRKQGKFKIIMPIDWPKGNLSGSTKFRDVPIQVLQQDGFEVVMTPAKSDAMALSEIINITNLIKSYVNPTAELRICVEALSRPEEEWMPYIRALSKTVPPDLIRIDHNNTTTKANAANHSDIVAKITANAPWPVKVSGNVTLKTALQFKNTRFGVSLKQAKDIIGEIKNAPDISSLVYASPDQKAG